MFKKFNFKFTCYAVGLAVEKNPEPVQAMVRDGHEIASHNHKWIDFEGLSEEQERSLIRFAISILA